MLWCSFTDNYEGKKRKVEIGVLYNQDDALAKVMQKSLSAMGYDARLNEPWSGLEGFMYASDRLTVLPKRVSVMIELRQDLLAKEEWRKEAAQKMLEILKEAGYA